MNCSTDCYQVTHPLVKMLLQEGDLSRLMSNDERFDVDYMHQAFNLNDGDSINSPVVLYYESVTVLLSLSLRLLFLRPHLLWYLVFLLVFLFVTCSFKEEEEERNPEATRNQLVSNS